MPLSINDKDLTVIASKGNKTFIKVKDNKTLDIQLHTNTYSLKKINNVVERLFSQNGLTIGDYTILAIGTNMNLTIRVYNNKTLKSFYYTKLELSNDLYLNNDNLPQNIKDIIGTVARKLEIIKLDVPTIKPLHRVKSKKAISVLSIPYCNLHKESVPLSKCASCGNLVSIKDNNIICALDIS